METFLPGLGSLDGESERVSSRSFRPSFSSYITKLSGVPRLSLPVLMNGDLSSSAAVLFGETVVVLAACDSTVSVRIPKVSSCSKTIHQPIEAKRGPCHDLINRDNIPQVL